MQPSISSSRSKLLMATGLCSALIYGCASGGGGTPATTATGGQPSNASSTGGSGNGTPGTGGATTFGSSGGNGSPSGSTGGSGTGNSGTPGTGGSGTNASGGSGFPTPGTGGNPGTSGGTGGSNQGGTVAPASGGAGGGLARACPVASPDVISDFEDGSAVMVKQGGRTGWWSTYYPGSPAALMAGMMQTPPHVDGPVAVAADPAATNPMCNKALHTTGSGFATAPNNYAGISAGFVPMAPPSMIKTAYDVSAYTGISFKIKSGTATPPPAVFFELLTKENQPATSGGTATATTIDLYNTRGQMLNAPWSPAITATWQTIYVPFATLVPRWMPAGFGGAMTCTTATPKCQAPKFVPTDVLGIQLSMYQDPGFPKPAGSTPGTYDLWIDDVTLVKGDMGLTTRTGFPLMGAGSVGANCTKPTGADGKYLIAAYNLWKQSFFVGGKIIRPENGNDTVSEGIAYGMLIAVNMNDQTLFDSLYSYWKSNSAGGSLMTWCIPSGGGSCNAQGGGSATDADEDAAFALLQAGAVWGGTYVADAKGIISDIWSKDIDKSSMLPTGGSNYANSTSSRLTNASYFAPAFYKAFKAAGDTNNWDGVVTAVYGVIGGGLSGSKGLFPAWCSGNCTAAGSNGAATDTLYQYDSHRIPWRIGLDYCWNGGAAAKSYLAKTSAFFQSQTSGGVAKLPDILNLDGTPGTGPAPNSSSILGTAAVGAMSDPAYKTFLDDAYQSVFDQVTRGTMAPVDNAGKTPYSYYNATVGLLTLLTMSGNFHH